MEKVFCRVTQDFLVQSFYRSRDLAFWMTLSILDGSGNSEIDLILESSLTLLLWTTSRRFRWTSGSSNLLRTKTSREVSDLGSVEYKLFERLLKLVLTNEFRLRVGFRDSRENTTKLKIYFIKRLFNVTQLCPGRWMKVV